jgi:hypothetical protein
LRLRRYQREEGEGKGDVGLHGNRWLLGRHGTTLKVSETMPEPPGGGERLRPAAAVISPQSRLYQPQRGSGPYAPAAARP